MDLNDYKGMYQIAGKTDNGEFILRPNHEALNEWVKGHDITYPAYFVGEIDQGYEFESALIFDSNHYVIKPGNYYAEMDDDELNDFIDDLRDSVEINNN